MPEPWIPAHGYPLLEYKPPIPPEELVCEAPPAPLFTTDELMDVGEKLFETWDLYKDTVGDYKTPSPPGAIDFAYGVYSEWDSNDSLFVNITQSLFSTMETVIVSGFTLAGAIGGGLLGLSIASGTLLGIPAAPVVAGALALVGGALMGGLASHSMAYFKDNYLHPYIDRIDSELRSSP